MKHLALLRGINVSGHNIIKMDNLKSILEKSGFLNVETYVQSGNMFVETEDENAQSVGFTIKQEIAKHLGFDVPVIVISKGDLEKCLTNNPFFKEKDVDTKKLYVAFISKELNSSAINELKISQFKPDEVFIDANRIYMKLETGAGNTKLTQKYIEKKLNVIATTRNWNTVNKLIELF
jgi:uncharacterized protein (DUF1697 family)